MNSKWVILSLQHSLYHFTHQFVLCNNSTCYLLFGFIKVNISVVLLYNSNPTCHFIFLSAAPRGPKLSMSPSKATVGDTVRITVQGFQLGPSAVSFSTQWLCEVIKLHQGTFQDNRYGQSKKRLFSHPFSKCTIGFWIQLLRSRQ